MWKAVVGSFLVQRNLLEKLSEAVDSEMARADLAAALGRRDAAKGGGPASMRY